MRDPGPDARHAGIVGPPARGYKRPGRSGRVTPMAGGKKTGKGKESSGQADASPTGATASAAPATGYAPFGTQLDCTASGGNALISSELRKFRSRTKITITVIKISSVSAEFNVPSVS